MRLEGWSVTVCDDVFSLGPQSCGGIREVRSGRLVRGWRGSRDLRILVCAAVKSSGAVCLPAAGTETILEGIPLLAWALIKRCNDLSHELKLFCCVGVVEKSLITLESAVAFIVGFQRVCCNIQLLVLFIHCWFSKTIVCLSILSKHCLLFSYYTIQGNSPSPNILRNKCCRKLGFTGWWHCWYGKVSFTVSTRPWPLPLGSRNSTCQGEMEKGKQLSSQTKVVLSPANRSPCFSQFPTQLQKA